MAPGQRRKAFARHRDHLGGISEGQQVPAWGIAFDVETWEHVTDFSNMLRDLTVADATDLTGSWQKVLRMCGGQF